MSASEEMFQCPSQFISSSACQNVHLSLWRLSNCQLRPTKMKSCDMVRSFWSWTIQTDVFGFQLDSHAEPLEDIQSSFDSQPLVVTLEDSSKTVRSKSSAFNQRKAISPVNCWERCKRISHNTKWFIVSSPGFQRRANRLYSTKYFSEQNKSFHVATSYLRDLPSQIMVDHLTSFHHNDLVIPIPLKWLGLKVDQTSGWMISAAKLRESECSWVGDLKPLFGAGKTNAVIVWRHIVGSGLSKRRIFFWRRAANKTKTLVLHRGFRCVSVSVATRSDVHLKRWLMSVGKGGE